MHKAELSLDESVLIPLWSQGIEIQVQDCTLERLLNTPLQLSEGLHQPAPPRRQATKADVSCTDSNYWPPCYPPAISTLSINDCLTPTSTPLPTRSRRPPPTSTPVPTPSRRP